MILYIIYGPYCAQPLMPHLMNDYFLFNENQLGGDHWGSGSPHQDLFFYKDMLETQNLNG